ncbi:hypothetical protein PBI_SCTP2_424 [Salicola phage SCTP-2]|nr:hypothetical protein PBI_SCTP2_424 [Salicola phage SCTP-2]
MGQGAEDADNAVVSVVNEDIEDLEKAIFQLGEVLKNLEYSKVYNKKECNVGDKIKCANCSKTVNKKSYQQVFCSSPKSGRKNCKDVYWNRVRGIKEKIQELEEEKNELF